VHGAHVTTVAESSCDDIRDLHTLSWIPPRFIHQDQGREEDCDAFLLIGEVKMRVYIAYIPT
jgi:hypothetical protein